MSEFSHRVPTAAYKASQQFGIPAVALCGHVWVPTTLDPDLPECQPCADRFAAIPVTYTYVGEVQA